MVIMQISFYDSFGPITDLGRKLTKVIWSLFVYVDVQSVIAWGSTHILIAYDTAFYSPCRFCSFSSLELCLWCVQWNESCVYNCTGDQYLEALEVEERAVII